MTGTRLTDHDRELLAQAHSLTVTPLMDGLRERTGNTDTISAFIDGWGEAMHLLTEQAAIITRLTEEDTDG